MLTHNVHVCFHGEIRKALRRYPVLSLTMNKNLEEVYYKKKIIFYKSTISR